MANDVTVKIYQPVAIQDVAKCTSMREALVGQQKALEELIEAKQAAIIPKFNERTAASNKKAWDEKLAIIRAQEKLEKLRLATENYLRVYEPKDASKAQH